MRPMFSRTFFFFNDTATTEIYTLSLHDALPICQMQKMSSIAGIGPSVSLSGAAYQVNGNSFNQNAGKDRKSTRLNSSHTVISYAVFCLKKKSLLVLDGACP